MEEIKVGMSTEEFVENLEVFNNSGEHINNPKAGDYIRTIDGYIRRIAKVNTERKAITYSGTYILDKPYKNSKSIARNKIKNHKENIIDLIEPGDYVNGKEVVYDVYNTDTIDKHKCIGVSISNDNSTTWTIADIEIKSIVTKEAMKSVEYNLDN